MPIVDSDLEFRFSVPSATRGNTTASGNKKSSLGKYASTTVLLTGLNTIFDKINGGEVHTGDMEYRCIFLLNKHSSITLGNGIAWVQFQITPGADIHIATDNIAASSLNSSSIQAATASGEGIAPTGISSWTHAYNGISIGNLPPGYVKALWFRRTIGTVGSMRDGFRLNLTGDAG